MDFLPSMPCIGARLSIPTKNMATDNVMYAPIPLSSLPQAATDIPTMPTVSQAVYAPTLFASRSSAVTNIPTTHTVSRVVYAPKPISSWLPGTKEIPAAHNITTVMYAPNRISSTTPEVKEFPAAQTNSPIMYDPTPIASRPPAATENIEIIPPPFFVPRTARRPRSRQITLEGIREAVKQEEEEDRNPIHEPPQMKSNKKSNNKKWGATSEKGEVEACGRSEVGTAKQKGRQVVECFSDLRDISSVPPPYNCSLTSAAPNFFMNPLMSAAAAASKNTLPYPTATETRGWWQTKQYYVDTSPAKGRKRKHKHKHRSKNRCPIEQRGDELPAMKRQKLDSSASAFTSTTMHTKKIIKLKIKFSRKNLNAEKAEEKNATQAETTERESNSSVLTEEVQSQNLISELPKAKVPFLFDLNELPPPDDD